MARDYDRLARATIMILNRHPCASRLRLLVAAPGNAVCSAAHTWRIVSARIWTGSRCLQGCDRRQGHAQKWRLFFQVLPELKPLENLLFNLIPVQIRFDDFKSSIKKIRLLRHVNNDNRVWGCLITSYVHEDGDYWYWRVRAQSRNVFV